MDRVDCIVVGAGVVGLAIARQLAQAGREVLVLEANESFGMETSARNSEVIHAGIYYPQGSLMARLCVEGRGKLYDYAQTRGLAHRKCGKLIVATTPAEVATLAGIRARAAANGAPLEILSRAEATAMEPALACEGALWSPETGVIDSHGYMLSLKGEAEAAGAMFAFHAPVAALAVGDHGFVVTTGAAEPMTLGCAALVNAAGHGAPGLAQAMQGYDAGLAPTAYFARGNYFTLAGRAPFSRLIYPVPQPGGLGVHLTLDLGGQAKFGPDVEWIDGLDYRVDPARGEAFYAAIRRYWPALPDGALQPGYAGIRPKIAPPEAGTQDFVLQGPGRHGIAGLVHLFGVESPGLTSSLAIAEAVAAML
ncbi:MAG: NAD(P)/FAD-dependent oxidoreductase [Methylobacteriaceae bacterium]|nr:NAD(P)/FAD-dependent oxidoreductase [Methylobacteriaceae bacterium]